MHIDSLNMFGNYNSVSVVQWTCIFLSFELYKRVTFLSKISQLFVLWYFHCYHVAKPCFTKQSEMLFLSQNFKVAFCDFVATAMKAVQSTLIPLNSTIKW